MKGDNSHPFDPQADLSQSRRKGGRKEGRKKDDLANLRRDGERGGREGETDEMG